MDMQALFSTAYDTLGIDGDSVSANLSFVTRGQIKRLNKESRGINKVTDVLSFPTLEIIAGKKPTHTDFPLDINPETNKLEIGDIVVCTSVAKQQARRFGHSMNREIAFLCLHGLLHLLGYDHIEKSDEEVMTRLADSILTKAGYSRGE
jgi:rRNA maturation RNase YbeY